MPTDLNVPDAQATADNMRSSGHEVIALAVHVTDGNAVTACVDQAIRHFGQVDILVNNAGIHSERLNETLTVEQLHRCWDVNLVGVWRMAQALIPHFRHPRSGKIVNIAINMDGGAVLSQPESL